MENENIFLGTSNSTTMNLQWRQSIPIFRDSVQQLVILLSNASGKSLNVLAKLFFVSLCVFVSSWENKIFAQLNTDNAYAKPLKQVLSDIEKKYSVKIKYADSMVANKTVNYAEWRYRNDVETTLNN